MSQQTANSPDTQSIITTDRIIAARRGMYNAINLLTFDSLRMMIDNFKYGTLDRMARTQQAICERDDTIVNTVLKRKAAVQRMDYVIHLDPEAMGDPAKEAEANRHKDQLEFFFKHMRATDALDKDTVGRFNLLKSQMMNAVLYKFQVHEVIWRPMPGALDGQDGLTATFSAAPLQFFENRTGEMKYIPWEGAYDGVPFENTGLLPNWMVTSGPWLSQALSIAYMYKQLALKDWVFYCDRHGSPAVVGSTSAPYGSDIWNQFLTAMERVGQNLSAVVYNDGVADNGIKAIDLGATGELPYPKLVERMDRAMAAILMGGDLSSLSRDNNAAGSNPQMDESVKLEDTDAELISETLNLNICQKVIEWHNGPGVIPLAMIQIVSPKKKDALKEIAVDTFLIGAGVKLGVDATLVRYDREAARENEEVLKAPVAPTNGKTVDNTGKAEDDSDLSNERGDVHQGTLKENGLRAFATAQARAMTPLWDRLDAVFHVSEMGDNEFIVALQKLNEDIPRLQKQMMRLQQPGRVLGGTMGAAMVNGMAEAEVA